MPVSGASAISRIKNVVVLCIAVINLADLFLAYQPFQHPNFRHQHKFPMRPILRPPRLWPRPPRLQYSNLNSNRIPLVHQRPILTQTQFPLNSMHLSTLTYTTEKPSTTTTAATTTSTAATTTSTTTQAPTSPITTIKMQLQLSEDSITSLLSSMERDGTLKDFGISRERLKSTLKRMWPAYKRASSQVLEREKIRAEMLQLRKQYLKKKEEYRKWNRMKQ